MKLLGQSVMLPFRAYIETQQNIKSYVGVVDRFKKMINRLAQYHTNFAVKIVAVNYKGGKPHI